MKGLLTQQRPPHQGVFSPPSPQEKQIENVIWIELEQASYYQAFRLQSFKDCLSFIEAYKITLLSPTRIKPTSILE